MRDVKNLKGRLLGFALGTIVAVFFVEILTPHMNLIVPELVCELVSLIQHAEANDARELLTGAAQR